MGFRGQGAGWGSRWRRRGWGSGFGGVAQPPPQAPNFKSGIIRVLAATDAPGIDAPVSPVFARAPYFVIVDLDGGRVVGEWDYPNTLAQGGGGGVGRMIAQWVASTGARIVVASALGDNAAYILQSTGLEVVIVSPGTRLRDVLKSRGLLK